MIMKKFKELLFLKNIKGLGNARINDKFLYLLDEFNDLDDLIAEIEFKFDFSLDNLENAKQKTEVQYESIINNSEIEIITLFDEKYPNQLSVMGNKKPLILYVKGDSEVLSKPNIAFIGTRKPIKNSEKFEFESVKSILNTSDRVIVSGLALGCDKIAHQVTVEENKPTIAVLPSGVNVIKPAKHKKLAEDIIKTGGCLVSEYDPDKKVTKGSYVERDVIVAALSDSIFVVECGINSGTMHTVNAAKDFNKQIYSYLPDERPEGSYEGNEFILNNIDSSIKIDNVEEFLEELETLNLVKKPKTVQQTLM